MPSVAWVNDAFLSSDWFNFPLFGLRVTTALIGTDETRCDPAVQQHVDLKSDLNPDQSEATKDNNIKRLIDAVLKSERELFIIDISLFNKSCLKTRHGCGINQLVGTRSNTPLCTLLGSSEGVSM